MPQISSPLNAILFNCLHTQSPFSFIEHFCQFEFLSSLNQYFEVFREKGNFLTGVTMNLLESIKLPFYAATASLKTPDLLNSAQLLNEILVQPIINWLIYSDIWNKKDFPEF